MSKEELLQLIKTLVDNGELYAVDDAGELDLGIIHVELDPDGDIKLVVL